MSKNVGRDEENPGCTISRMGNAIYIQRVSTINCPIQKPWGGSLRAPGSARSDRRRTGTAFIRHSHVVLSVGNAAAGNLLRTATQMATPDILDFEVLLAPVSEENPAGPELKEDPAQSAVYYSVKDAREAARTAERMLLAWDS